MSYDNSTFSSQLAAHGAKFVTDGRAVQIAGNGYSIITWDEGIAGDPAAVDAAEYAVLSAAAAASGVMKVMADPRLSDLAKREDAAKVVAKQQAVVTDKLNILGTLISTATRAAEAALIPPGPAKDDVAGAVVEMENRNFLRGSTKAAQLSAVQDPATAATVLRNPLGFDSNIRDLATRTLRNAPGKGAALAAAESRLRAYQSARSTAELARDALAKMLATLPTSRG